MAGILWKVLSGSNVMALSVEEQQTVAKGLANSRLDSTITRHLKNSPQCLTIVCSSKVLDYFSVFARARNHFHLDVLEAVFIKVHSSVLCQQKEFVKVLYLV